MRILCDEIDNWKNENFPHHEDTITYALEGRLVELTLANKQWIDHIFAFDGIVPGKTYRIRGKKATKEEFFYAVHREYPEFFIWLMFNSNAFS